MDVSLATLAEWVQGTVEGDPTRRVRAARSLADAGPDDVTFLDSPKNLLALQRSPASVAIVGPDVAAPGKTLIRVRDPFAAFVAVYQKLHARAPLPRVGVDPRAAIDPSATLAADVDVHPFAAIGAGTSVGPRTCVHAGVRIGRDCVIGADVVLHPNAVLYDGVRLGDRCIVHANAVLGADGFGYRLQKGRHAKVPQLGSVELGADVEVGACTTIDRGTFGATRIGEGTKIDNLVQIGHNCEVGRHNLFVSQVGVAGSSSTGDYVVLAGQVGVADHIRVGDRAVVGAKSGIAADVDPDQKMFGIPARPALEQKRIHVALGKLPALMRELEALKKRLGMADAA